MGLAHVDLIYSMQLPEGLAVPAAVELIAELLAAVDLGALSREWEIPAAQLALAFALDHPRLSSLLFGATSPAQLQANLGALDVHTRLEPEQWVRLRQVGAP